MIDPDYSSKQGSFKTFPGIQSATLILKASSNWNSEETAELGKFNLIFAGRSEGWCPYSQNQNQYFQVGSSIPFVYEGLKIGGRNIYSHYITSYKLSYSLDGSTWLPYKNSQIFIANSDSVQPVEHLFEPFIARSVRLIPQSWVSFIGGRFEFYISKSIYSNILPNNTLISAVASGCKLTSSSVYTNNCGITQAGYDIENPRYGCSAWCAAVNDFNQWIMVTSVFPVKWKRIGTMGNKKNTAQMIRSYYIMYSVDGSSWLDYKNKQVFIANYDSSTKVEYDLDEFIAVSVRFHPLTWNDHICTRIEAYYSSI